MSQDKVNKYKEEKRNRKKNLAKEKRIKLIKKIGYSLIGVLVAGWVVFCCVRIYQDANKPTLSNAEIQSLINEMLSQQAATSGQTTTKAGETTTKEGETTTVGETTTTKEGETTTAGETTTTKEGETTANSETTTNKEEETTKQ